MGQIQSEEQLIDQIQDKIQEIKGLVTLANEIGQLVERENDKSICAQMKISQNILDSNY